MSKILFLNQPSVGHLNTLLTIALQMREDGHQPEFLVPGSKGHDFNIEIIKTAALIPNIIEKNGFAVKLVRPPLSTLLWSIFLPLASGYNEFMLAMELAGTGIQYYTQLILKHLEEQRPDMVVTDFSLFPAYLAAERAGIPYATVYHSGLPFSGKLIPPFGSGLPINENAPLLGKAFLRREQFVLNRLDARLNHTRRKLGLATLAPKLLSRPYSQWLNLITSAEAIEAPRDNLTDNTFFIGPCFGKRKEAHSDFPFDQLQPNKYKVYVSLGTVFNNKPQVFRKIMAALDHPDYQVIISAGGAFAKLKQSTNPQNALIFPSVPQIDLLPLVDLVIGHGGNNSTNETLAAGKPLIVMPIGGEQGDNASRIEYLQVGLRLNIHNFDEQEVKTKVNAIRVDKNFQKRATQLKEALAQTDGAKSASELIQWVAQQGKPLLRPPEFPLTVTKDNRAQLVGKPPF